jgi:hypothetical protein
MTISDRNRIYFEAIGLAEIRRELVVGVAEQEGKNRETERVRTARENKMLRYTFLTLIAAIVAAVAAIVMPMIFH